MRQKLCAILGALLVSSALASTGAVAQSRPLDNSFTVSGINWSGAGQTTFIYSVDESNGKAVVCGVYINEGAVPRVVVSKLLRESRVRVGRTTLLNGVGFFTEVQGSSALKNVKATCKASHKAWKASFKSQEPRISSPRNFEY